MSRLVIDPVRQGSLEEVLLEAGLQPGSAAERSLVPVLLVGLGGTGAEVLRRVKQRVQWLGLGASVRFLVVDMDRNTQNPARGLPGFEAREFCYLSRRQIQNVFQYPDLHPEIVNRLDLDNPETKRVITTIAASKESGAGQVRAVGLLGLEASRAALKASLETAINDLTSRWGALEQKMAEDDPLRVEIANRFIVHFVASSCGGVGSSSLIDAAVMLHQLVGGRDLRVTATLTMPDVYYHAVKEKIGEWDRLQANGYATIRELDCFQNGHAPDLGIRMSAVASAQELPRKLFDWVYLVERVDANDKDLGTLESVFDSIALHVSADVGTTIHGHLASEEANNAASQGLVICPHTHKPRIYSTFGATALAVPTIKLLRYCTYHQCYQYFENTVLGNMLHVEQVEQTVNDWLLSTRIEERSTKDASFVIDRLRESAFTGIDSYVSSIEPQQRGSQRVYLKDTAFTREFDAVRQAWRETHLPEIARQLQAQSDQLQNTYQVEFRHWIAAVIEQRGLRASQQITHHLQTVLEAIQDELAAEARQDDAQAYAQDELALEATGPLRTYFGSFGTDAGRQSRAVGALRSAMNASVDADAKQAAGVFFSQLKEAVQREALKIQQASESVDRQKQDFERRAVVSRPEARAINSASLAEIDVMSPEFCQAFFAEHMLSHADLAMSMAAGQGVSIAQLYRNLDAETSLSALAVSYAGSHFIKAVKGLNIVDLLTAEAKQSTGSRNVALAKFEEALKACQPLWRANPRKIDARFSDSIIVGVPLNEADLPAFNRTSYGKMLPNVASDLTSPLYQARLDTCTTHDPHRIYAVRRSHGGLPIYLNNWSHYLRAYEAWHADGNRVPLHIFPQRVINAMPSLEVTAGGSDAELSFALAMAFGWIAVRGHSNFYFNLHRHNGADVLNCPSVSHWDNLAFEKKKLRPKLGSLQKLVAKQALKFGSADPDSRHRLSSRGRAAAADELARTPSAIELIISTYRNLCVVAGNGDVSADLNIYVESVAQRLKPTDELRDRIEGELTLLRREIQRLGGS
jgi:hypothetical protein